MIDTLEQLNQVVNDVVNRIVQYSTERTMSSNYYASYDMVSDLISYEDYLSYFDFIGNELASREEVLDFDQTKDKEFDVVYGTDWCPNYEDHEENFVAKSVSQPLSMTRKAQLLDRALENIQKELDRSGEDRVQEVAEFFGISVEELSRLDLPAAKEAELESATLTEEISQRDSEQDYSRPIEFFVYSKDYKEMHTFGSFEEALDAYNAVPKGEDKEMGYKTYKSGTKSIQEEGVLFQSNELRKDWYFTSILSSDPHVRLAAAKTVLTREPNNLKAWDVLNISEAEIGVTGHRLGPHDLLVGNWRVHLVPPGCSYGTNETILNTSGKYVVEFYDMRYKQPFRFPNGQFTGASYFADTLLGEEGWAKHDQAWGLCLDNDIPSWTVNAAQMRVVLKFLQEETVPKQKTSLKDRICDAESRTQNPSAAPRAEKDTREF